MSTINEPAPVAEIQRLVSVHDLAELKRLVRRSPIIAAPLETVCRAIREVYGPATPISLEAAISAEFPDGVIQLDIDMPGATLADYQVADTAIEWYDPILQKSLVPIVAHITTH